jgi:hypothetical protein
MAFIAMAAVRHITGRRDAAGRTGGAGLSKAEISCLEG